MSIYRRLFFTLAGVGIFGLTCWHYYPFLADDALISLRYSTRLVDGKGLTWNDGYYVEGYSNLAWVLLAALLNWIGLDPIAAIRGLGLVLTSGALATFVWIGVGRSRSALTPVLLLLFASSHTVAIWAIGGLEQPLVLATLFASTVALLSWWEHGYPASKLWIAGGWLAVLALTRPDGPLFAVLSGLFPLLSSQPLRERVRDLLRLAALPALAVVGQLSFRLAYYGALMPNTAQAKLSFSAEHTSIGGAYLVAGIFTNLVPVVIVFAIAIRDRRNLEAPFWILAAMFAAWSAYLVAIGGDFFPGFRHFIPLTALAWTMTLCIVTAPTLSQGNDFAMPTIATAASIAVAVFSLMQVRVPINELATSETLVRDCEGIAKDLRDEFRDSHPTIAVTAAGCLSYWTGFETVDLLGLNDLELPKRKPANFGSGFLGHELGDLSYLLERAPEIVVFLTGNDPVLIYKEQIAGDPSFGSAYCRTTRDYPRAGRRIVFYRRDFAAKGQSQTVCALSEGIG